MATSPIIPHSFVLADLFDVEAQSLDVPDHLYEDEPGLEPVPCPECDGEGKIEVEEFVLERLLSLSSNLHSTA